MSNPRNNIMFFTLVVLCLSGPLKSFTVTNREVACHVTTRVRGAGVGKIYQNVLYLNQAYI